MHSRYTPSWLGGAELPPSKRLGTVLSGMYRLDEFLGEGSVGQSYRAWHLLQQRPVRVKLVRCDQPLSQELVLELTRELRALTTLKYHGFVPGELLFAPDGAPFLVSEYQPGETLRQRLQRGPMPPLDTGSMVAILARALEEAHHLGLVHGSLCPENVVLPAVAMEEFTVAQVLLLDAALFPLGRRGGAPADKPAYVAPEVLAGAGRAEDTGGDIYALGSILYECLTGRRVEPDKDAPPRLLPSDEGKLPAPLLRAVNLVIATSLARAPDRRPPTMEKFLESLSRAYAGAGLALPSLFSGKATKPAGALGRMAASAGEGAGPSRPPALPPARSTAEHAKHAQHAQIEDEWRTFTSAPSPPRPAVSVPPAPSRSPLTAAAPGTARVEAPRQTTPRIALPLPEGPAAAQEGVLRVATPVLARAAVSEFPIEERTVPDWQPDSAAAAQQPAPGTGKDARGPAPAPEAPAPEPTLRWEDKGPKESSPLTTEAIPRIARGALVRRRRMLWGTAAAAGLGVGLLGWALSQGLLEPGQAGRQEAPRAPAAPAKAEPVAAAADKALAPKPETPAAAAGQKPAAAEADAAEAPARAAEEAKDAAALAAKDAAAPASPAGLRDPSIVIPPLRLNTDQPEAVKAPARPALPAKRPAARRAQPRTDAPQGNKDEAPPAPAEDKADKPEG